jgi:hypothetical protein
MSEFAVLDTKVEVTDMKFPAETGSDTWKALYKQMFVDLSHPDQDCLVPFAKLPELAPNLLSYGAIKGKSKAIMALLQASIQDFVQKAGIDPNYSSDIDGVFNCKDAAAMVVIAQAARQQGVGDYSNWPIGPTEFFYLMTRSPLVQFMIASAVQEAGSSEGYQGAVIAVPVAEVPELVFVPAQVPSTCQGTSPQPEPVIGTVPTCQPGQVVDLATRNCSTPTGPGTTPVTAKDQAKTSSWYWPVVIGGGVLAAGGLAWYYTRRSRMGQAHEYR